MEKILRECLGCKFQAKNKQDLLIFVKDSRKINNYQTKAWCRSCDAKKRKDGKVHGPNLIKKCRDCGTFPTDMKDLDRRFVKDKGMSLGYGNLCKECNRKRVKAHMKERPDLFKKRTRRYTIRQYGIQPEEFELMIKKQNNRCAICLNEFNLDKETPHIDHDHKCCSSPSSSCGKCVRGILCRGCNHGIGIFKENTASLQNAIIYLKRR
jgi:hypothetical protein